MYALNTSVDNIYPIHFDTVSSFTGFTEALSDTNQVITLIEGPVSLFSENDNFLHIHTI